MTLEIEAQLPPFQDHQQLHRVPATCELHPEEVVTGFCASCLRERLASLEPSTTTHRKSTSSSSTGLKSLFFKASGQPSFLRPELRRCKSFSASRGDGFAGPRLSTSSLEPQRRSCDVRGRSTLGSLFHQDDRERIAHVKHHPSVPSSSSAAAVALGCEIEIESKNPAFALSGIAAAPVLETREEKDEEIRVVDPVLVVEAAGEINRVEEEEEEEAEVKAMKEHIGVDASQAKKPPPAKDLKEIAGSFWVAASVFSKKLQKWRRKQKFKKQDSKQAPGMQVEKPPSSRRFRDTQSEIAMDASGRRSCDIDPRFSLDAGRISLDDPRYSLDEPRASWDGYLIGGRSVFPRLPPMLAVVEDPPAPIVQRSDGQIPVEEDAMTPGGSAQTRDYYLDSSSQRPRRSLDRLNSSRKLTVEMNDLKLLSNAKVSPASTTEFFHANNGDKLDKDPRDSSSTSLRDDGSENFGSACRDPQKAIPMKKSKRWGKAWNIWGFIHWRTSGRGGGGGGANVVERSFSESWPELRRNGYNGKMLRSNSSVSSRYSFSNGAGFGSMRRSSVETNGHGKKRREELVSERNHSGRYSPSHVDNGMLRFYLTPMRSSRQNGVPGKSSHWSSESFTRTMLRMY